MMEQRLHLQSLVAAMIARHGLVQGCAGVGGLTACCSPPSEPECAALRRAYAAARPQPSAQLDLTVQSLLAQGADPLCRERHSLFEFYRRAGLGEAEAESSACKTVDQGYGSEKKLALALSRNEVPRGLGILGLTADDETLVEIALTPAF